MENSNPIVFIAPVHWNYYPYREQVLTASIADRGYPCIYLNPVNYKGCEKASRFTERIKKDSHKNIQILNRNSRWRKSLAELIYENILNIRAIKKFKPVSVISTDHLMSLGACIYCKFKKIRFVFDVTDNWELVDNSKAGIFYKLLIKPLLARLSYAVTCTSLRQFNYFQARRKSNTFLISNGINPRVQEELNKLDKNLPAVNEVNFIGSLRDWYDFDLLIEIFKNFRDIELNIYGLGAVYDELKIRTDGISNIHIRGNIDNQKTPGLLIRSLFGVLPLKVNELNHSTCPIKLFDYWGASKAVISTPVEEVKRVGGDAILYASTKEEFIYTINKLLNDRELLEQLGKKGKRKTEQLYNYNTITDQFLQILNN